MKTKTTYTIPAGDVARGVTLGRVETLLRDEEWAASVRADSDFCRRPTIEVTLVTDDQPDDDEAAHELGERLASLGCRPSVSFISLR